MGSALLCRWLSSAVSISSPPILAGNTFGIKHIEMTAGIRVAEFGFSCPARGMGEPQRGNPYVTQVVRLEACFDQECVDHHEVVGAVMGCLRVGHVLKGCSVVDHEKGPCQGGDVEKTLTICVVGGCGEDLF